MIKTVNPCDFSTFKCVNNVYAKITPFFSLFNSDDYNRLSGLITLNGILCNILHQRTRSVSVQWPLDVDYSVTLPGAVAGVPWTYSVRNVPCFKYRLGITKQFCVLPFSDFGVSKVLFCNFRLHANRKFRLESHSWVVFHNERLHLIDWFSINKIGYFFELRFHGCSNTSLYDEEYMHLV